MNPTGRGPSDALPSVDGQTVSRPKSEKRQRTRMVAVRMTSTEHDDLTTAAQAAGMTPSAFLRVAGELLASIQHRETTHA